MGTVLELLDYLRVAEDMTMFGVYVHTSNFPYLSLVRVGQHNGDAPYQPIALDERRTGCTHKITHLVEEKPINHAACLGGRDAHLRRDNL
jgi:hypothetical protein